MAIVYPLIDRGDGKFEQLQAGDTLPGALGGTVTSVGITAPAFLSVSGSPITGAGTLALSLANQAANTFFMGPSSGGSAAPTFRAPVLADIPTSALGTGGSSTDFLRKDRTWQTISLSPAGSNTQLQYNNAGAFGASANMTFNGNLNVLNTANIVLDKNLASDTQGVFELKVVGNTRFLMNPYDAGTATRFAMNPISGQPAIITSSSALVFDAQSSYNGWSNTLAYISFRGGNNEYVRFDGTTQRACIGHPPNATPNAILELLPSGSEIGLIIRGVNNPQMKIEYDASNDARFTVNSAGTLTINNVGSTPKTVFSDPVEVVDGGIFGPMVVDTDNVSIDRAAGVYFDNDFTPRVVLGDWNANGNGTQLAIDDNNQQVNRNVGNGGLFAQIGGKLFQHYTNATTSGTTQQNLYTYTLPAGTLMQDGDTIKVEYGGIFTAANRNKRIYPKFAGQILATGDVTNSTATYWAVDYYIIRVSNTVVRYVVEFTSKGEPVEIADGEITGLNLTSTAYNLDLDGRTVTTAGDLTVRSGYGVFHPAA